MDVGAVEHRRALTWKRWCKTPRMYVLGPRRGPVADVEVFYYRRLMTQRAYTAMLQPKAWKDQR